jgi:hypothetical protein
MRKEGPQVADELIHTGSQNVPGYRPQTQSSLDAVKQIKLMEADVSTLWKLLRSNETVDVDPRLMALARTHFTTAFMYFNRAVFQPADPFDD